jgi:aspartate dehydrogenase
VERVVVIGFGAIAQTIVRLLRSGNHARLHGIVEAESAAARTREKVDVPVCTSIHEALALKPSLVVECAGHGALREHAQDVLRAGVDLLVASVGALAHQEIENMLYAAAKRGGAQLLIPSGALGGLDALGSSRYAGLEHVMYTSVKAVAAWRGTHAERLVKLDCVEQPTVFFTGNARQAAQLFPQNANVAAAVALAGCGFEKTVVALTADPAAKGNRHRVQASGPFGHIDVTVEGKVLPENPKTSMLAPMSIVRAIESRSSSIQIV